jgi:3'-5' exoribonuclease
MVFVEDLTEGKKIQNNIFLVRKVTNGTTKVGKPFQTLLLQDKTGSIEGKIWSPNDPAFEDVEEKDYVEVSGDVTSFNGALQIRLERVSKAQEGTYKASDYLPSTDKNPEEMYKELLRLVDSVKTDYLKELLDSFFRDPDFKKRFCFHSAAKSVHHGFVGGLLEHTLSVAQICNFYAKHYPMIDRDLLITAALCHDIGKLEEIAPYPQNDYTDEGQLIGHIVIGAGMIRDKIRDIPHFPHKKEEELLHCILSHHGELEFGSPKKPALIEAMALSHADNLDAKIETMKEALKNAAPGNTEWQGYNRFLETNIRRTSEEE